MSPKPPDRQYWAINGQVLMEALQSAYGGTDPSIVYLELIANSDTKDVGKDNGDE